MNHKYLMVIFLLLAGVIACKKGVIESFSGFQQPANFPAPLYRFQNNPITQQGFELGRKLFYDPILSANHSISCGNCHIQTSAFTQHGHSVSHGINDLQGTRNSPPLMNLAWTNSFMWDGGIGDLDLQPIAPITSHVEMGSSMADVIGRLSASAPYPTLFEKAFGSKDITSVRLLKSLSQFMLLCVSSQSKYDSVMRQEGAASFTNTELQGYNIFKQHCGNCHKEPLFTDNSFRNNGLSISARNDKGHYLITLQDNDLYRFKVPSLRNLSYTAPYMHDGRFFTLEAVLDHYSSQVQLSPTLDPLLQQNTQPGIPLSAGDKNLLLAFLQTLNDRNFLLDKKLSEQ